MRSVAAVRPGLAGALAAQTMVEAFPDIDWMMDPLGNAVIVQMRAPKLMSAGGIALPGETTDWDASMLRVGKVVAIGPLAYKNRDTMKDWPEGAWIKIGDFVRVPVHAGTDGWKIYYGDKKSDWVQFSSFNDYDIKNRVRGNPLDIVDYV